MKAFIRAIETYLPEAVLTNQDLAAQFPEWSVDRIAQKTGIEQRHVAGPDEFASDLAFKAARKLLSYGSCEAADVDFVLLCTQSPDYVLPTTACLLQQRLGLRQSAGAIDFNLGCSGYIYGLGLAQGLILSGQAKTILFLTAETYSKYLDPADRSSITIFGDGAAATLIAGSEAEETSLRPSFVYGTDGSGGDHLIVRGAGRGVLCAPGQKSRESEGGALRMDGPEIFTFTLRVVPACVRSLLEKAGKRMDEIDLFVFHQANQYMLEHLRKKLEISEEKFYLSLAHYGNTVSSTIPIALHNAWAEGRLKAGSQVMLVGFGVGLSWGATLLRWPFLGA